MDDHFTSRQCQHLPYIIENMPTHTTLTAVSQTRPLELLRHFSVLLPSVLTLTAIEDFEDGLVPEVHGFRPGAERGFVHVENFNVHRYDHVLEFLEDRVKCTIGHEHFV